MATRRQVFCARRRGAHHQARMGTVPQQASTGQQQGGGKGQKATRAQKPQRA